MNEKTPPRVSENQLISPKRYSDESKEPKVGMIRKKSAFSGFMSSIGVGSPRGVKLYQGVTLGALSFPKDDSGELVRGRKRHPTIEEGVVIYANATVLGGETVVGAHSIIGASVSLTQSVPPNTMVTIEKPELRFREAGS